MAQEHSVYGGTPSSIDVSKSLIGLRFPTNRDAIIAHYLRLYKAIGSPGFPTDEVELRQRIAPKAVDAKAGSLMCCNVFQSAITVISTKSCRVMAR